MFHTLPNLNSKILPQRFTYPFHYEAHPWCKMAAEELQNQLNAWQWDKESQGKMFGVLIVRNKQGELGYLWAYSGNLTDKMEQNSFVPPIYDLLATDSFFNEGEKELIAINKHISNLEQSETLRKAKETLNATQSQSILELNEKKTKNTASKKARKERREGAIITHSSEDLRILESQLIKQSQREKSQLHQLKKQGQGKINAAQEELNLLIQEINGLKQKRQQKSAVLQQQLFDQYQLLNAKGEVKNLYTIFHDFMGKYPPAAAGDCAAPRLLQYAYKNELHPLAMAEFWWGKSPKTILRKQGHYYPSCRGKCEPILSHMLQGLEVDDNPIDKVCPLSIEIIHEDDDLLIINKPEGVLSVAGKLKQTCVLDQLKALRPDVAKPFIVHRLDMAASGLLVVAKNEISYKSLQAQFQSRHIKKRYEAVLNGIIQENSGRIVLPLRVDLNNRPQQMVCYKHGKPALTRWKVIERKDGKTRIAFYPITGRTHQLRMHAAHPQGLNTPIVGDELYGTKANRLHLHATYIELTHPTSRKTVRFNSEIPF